MSNLKYLLTTSPKEMILTSSWFEQNGISSKSVFDHKKYGWIDSIGRGAYVKKGVKPNLTAAISAIQTQNDYKIHLGGLYSLDEYQGIRHYLRDNLKPQLFLLENKLLPSWFIQNFKDSYELINSSFLPEDIGIEERTWSGSNVKISGTERALLEMLYVGSVTTTEAFQIMELVTVLKPSLMNELLEQCKSIKVKRLFLFLASQTGYTWYNKINRSIDLGSGVREIDKGGSYNKEFNIVVNKV
jgi:hypothetical protein